MKMELVRGTNLASFFQDRREKNIEIPPRLTRDIIGRILSAVNYLHGRKIIHRDLKPGIIKYMEQR